MEESHQGRGHLGELMTAMPWWRPAGHVAITIVLGCAACGASAQDAASSYPEKPVRLIDPFPPGGGSGLVARLVGQKLTETWSHPFVVDNRGGAGGSMGTDIAAKSVPDGYTLLIGTASAMVINPHMSAAPYDPLRDFAPIVLATTIPLIIVVHPSIPAKTLRELIALARAQPGKLNFGSSGNGTISHLAGELFKNLTGAQIVQVPYKGGGPALIDLLGGQVQLTFNKILLGVAASACGKNPRAGGYRRQALTRRARGADCHRIRRCRVRSGAVERIFCASAYAARHSGQAESRNGPGAVQSDIRERLAGEGAEVAGGSAERFSAFVAAEYTKWGKVIREANIRSN